MTAHAAPPYATPDDVARVREHVHTLGTELGALAVELRRHIDLAETPAHMETFELDANRLTRTSQSGAVFASVGLLNLNSFAVYFAVDGGLPTAAGGALAVPAGKLLVLPLAAQDIAVGVDAANVAGGPAFVHVLRFFTVQPAYLGG